MLAKLKHVLDRMLELLVTVAMAVLVLDVVWQVASRYILKNPSSWSEELATFLMIWVGLLGGSVALNRGAHLGIDYLVAKFPPKIYLLSALFGFAVTAIFSLLVMVIGGVELVVRTLATQQVSAALGWKMGYVYLAIPISGFFLVLYSAEIFIETLAAMSSGKRIRFQSGSASAGID